MSPRSATIGMVDGDELGAVRERALDLHLVDHLGDAVGDVGPAEQLAPEIHQLGHRAAVADELEDLRRDERDRLRMIEPMPRARRFCARKPA